MEEGEKEQLSEKFVAPMHISLQYPVINRWEGS